MRASFWMMWTPNRCAKLFQSAFQNSGQVCIALKRLYVHETIYDDICNELVTLAEAAVVGNGLHQGSQRAAAKPDAIRQGQGADCRCHNHGTVLAAAARHKGYFIRPTIVRDIEDGTALVDEEQFGPCCR